MTDPKKTPADIITALLGVIGEDPDTNADMFRAAMERHGVSDKAGYLGVRDLLRGRLRDAEMSQRALRRREIVLRDLRRSGAASDDGDREDLYRERVLARPEITRLIALRRAGKRWAAAATAPHQVAA